MKALDLCIAPIGSIKEVITFTNRISKERRSSYILDITLTITYFTAFDEYVNIKRVEGT